MSCHEIIKNTHSPIVIPYFFCYHKGMSQRVIDLRKPAPVQTAQPPMAELAASVNVSPPAERGADAFDLKWSAYEHEHRIHGRYWLLYPLAIATIGIVFSIVTRDYLFIAFIVISFAILIQYARRSPRLLAYAIEKRGVWIESKLMDFGKIKSFWIFRHPFMVSELLLETERPISPIMRIRLENVSPEMVKNVMSRYVPEKEQKDLASDQIARIIGF